MRDIHSQRSVGGIYRNQIQLELVTQRQNIVCVCILCLGFGWIQPPHCVRTAEGLLLTGKFVLYLCEVLAL